MGYVFIEQGGDRVIYEAFMQLGPEIREKILNAAFEEFAEHGFSKASTNKIVKSAGISKGALFYYFNSKKELYEYLADYGLSLVEEAYLPQIDGNETDFIEKCRSLSAMKMKLVDENPQAFRFFSSAYISGDLAQLSEATRNRLIALSGGVRGKIYANIDISAFRKDISHEKIIQMIRWCMEGYEKELTDRIKREAPSDFHDAVYWDEFDGFLKTLKTVFYLDHADSCLSNKED